jgi:hypothetical protein
MNDNKNDPQKLDQLEKDLNEKLEEQEKENKDFDNLLDEHQEQEKEFNSEFEEDTQKTNKIDLDLTEDELKKELEKSEKRQDKKVKEIEKKFKDISKQTEHTVKKYDDPKLSPYYENNISDSIENHEIREDKILLKKLTKIFLLAKGKPRIRPDQQGHEISIPDYLISKVDPNHKDLFKQYKKDQALTIYFLIDQSVSMRSNIQQVTELLKTFYMSASRLRKIKIMITGFGSGNLDYRGLGVDTIRVKSLKDIGKISNVHGGTPTQYALKIVRDDLKKISGNKLLIVFTDGQPNGLIEKQQGDRIIGVNYEDTIDFNRYLIKDMEKKKIVSFGVMLGSSNSQTKELMNKVFDKNYSVCENMQEARTNLTKVFQNTITHFLNKA